MRAHFTVAINIEMAARSTVVSDNFIINTLVKRRTMKWRFRRHAYSRAISRVRTASWNQFVPLWYYKSGWFCVGKKHAELFSMWRAGRRNAQYDGMFTASLGNAWRDLSPKRIVRSTFFCAICSQHECYHRDVTTVETNGDRRGRVLDQSACIQSSRPTSTEASWCHAVKTKLSQNLLRMTFYLLDYVGLFIS